MFDGATILAGGFGLSGIPENCIRELARRKVTDLTIVSNNCGTTDKGLGILLAQGQVKKMVSSYVGENKIFEQQFLVGPARGRALPAGHARRAAARRRRRHRGVLHADRRTARRSPRARRRARSTASTCVLEHAIRGDFAIVKAWKGDRWGNLVFRKTSRNFNPLCAQAGKVTIAEVEELVEVGELDPDQVHLPSIYVQRIFQGTDYEKPIEQRTVRKRS